MTTQVNVNFQHFPQAPKNGSHRVEKSHGAREAILIGVCLLFLSLIACSPQPRHRVDLLSPAEAPAANLPKEVVATVAPENAELNLETQDDHPSVSRLKAFAKEDAVQLRVRRVTGWLGFLRNKAVYPKVLAGWQRLQAGRFLLNEVDLQKPAAFAVGEDAVPPVSRLEYDLWREILTDEKSSVSIDTVAWLLSAAIRPDDVQDIDNLLIDSSPLPHYE